MRLLERNEAPAERETVVDSETYIAAFLFAEGGNLVPNNEVVASIFVADDNFRLSLRPTGYAWGHRRRFVHTRMIFRHI